MPSVIGAISGKRVAPFALLGLLLLVAAAEGRAQPVLHHDSRDPLYRSPSGAVTVGTPVTLRLRTERGDVSSVTAFTWDEASRRAARHPLRRAWRQGAAELWEVTLPPAAEPSVLRYRFVVRTTEQVFFYEDDPPRVGHEPDGGSGRLYERSPDRGWTLTSWDPAFVTPAWAQGAVIYQVFPDRFANGDPTNDPKPTDPTVHGRPVVAKAWPSRPEGSCRYYTDTCCTEDPRQRDFFGGDLEGLRQKLPYLADLGVDAIYLNPIFSSATNHKYDTRDYERIDPAFGDAAAFDRLAAEAGALGLRLILDGVFNHASSDSVYFDKESRYASLGAWESPQSPYASWFTFDPWPDGYRKWFGVDSLPVLAETPGVERFFWGDEGIAHRWLDRGAAGWRLDAMEQKSHRFWREFRAAVRARHPDALIVGEYWHDATEWLTGRELDSVMNYRFRDALVGFVNGDTVDANGRIAGLSPSQLDAVLRAYMEQYPPPTHHVLMNLVDSHDTERILWTLAPGRDRPEEKEQGGGYEAAVGKLKLLSTLQATLPGAPTVYYGDEAGLSGDTDPDNRRPYPWGAERRDLQEHYRWALRLRRELPCLRTGEFTTLLADDASGVLAFARHAGECAVLVVANPTGQARSVDVPGIGVVAVGAGSAVVRALPRLPAPVMADPLAGWEPSPPTAAAAPVTAVPPPPGPRVAPVVEWSSHAAVALRVPAGACEPEPACAVLRRRPGTDAFSTVAWTGGGAVDTDVLRGETWEYATGVAGPWVSVTIEPPAVDVTLEVAVPAGTTDVVHVAGSFQGWDADASPMTRGADGIWRWALRARQGERLEYKYTLGSWDAVEKGASLEELPFRIAIVEPGPFGTQRVADRVLRWRDTDPCRTEPGRTP